MAVKLEVGKKYVNREGDIVEICIDKPNACYPEHTYWDFDERRSYTESGYIDCDGEKHPFDLIAEYIEPPEQALTAADKQVGGDHYKSMKIQPHVYCRANKLLNLESEAISYISRYDKKWAGNMEKQIEDIEKAIHSLELLIDHIKAEFNQQ